MWTILLSALLFACGTPGGGEEQKNYGPTTSTVVGAKAVSEAEDNEVIGKGEATARVDGSILERHQKLGTNPKDAIGLWLEAAVRAQANEQQGWDALKELTLPLRNEANWQKLSSNRYFVDRIKNQNPAFRSFFVGATPENGYSINLSDLRIDIAYEGDKDVRGRKFMLKSSGASMPRPIYLKKSTKSGLFYVEEYSSMYVDVMPPIDKDEEHFE